MSRAIERSSDEDRRFAEASAVCAVRNEAGGVQTVERQEMTTPIATRYGTDVPTLIKRLSAEIRGCVDLRYSGFDGNWSVHVPFGNMMSVLPESVSKDPVVSLNLALNRWYQRSPAKPFMPGDASYEIAAGYCNRRRTAEAAVLAHVEEVQRA